MKNLVFVLCAALSTQALAWDEAFVEKIKRYFQANGLNDAGTDTINPSELTGGAKNRYAILEKSRMCKKYNEACPVAYKINAYGTNVIVIDSSDSDGVEHTYIYSTGGKFIVSGGQTESSGWMWDDE